MKPHLRACSDCQGPLQPVRILDATQGGLTLTPEKEAFAHVTLSYASPESEQAMFTGRIPRSGIVRGYICSECGRIFLYGEPTHEHDKDKENSKEKEKAKE